MAGLPEGGREKKDEEGFMKGVKVILIIMACGLLAVGFSGVAQAFHSGGVAECGGCHSMHSFTGNDPKENPKPNTALLKGADQSSTCLNCHASPDTVPTGYHIMTYPIPGTGIPPAEMTPGGDFAWLGKTYNFTVRGAPTTEDGQTHGHNVVASDYGLTADTQVGHTPNAPGGNFPTANLACNSCHDPHGKYRRIGGDTGYSIVTSGAPIIGSGSYANSAVPTATQAVGAYRLLAGMGYSKAAFPGVPIAVVPSTYNQSEATNQVRAAYGYSTTGSGKTNWGEWCGTCHTQMHSGNTATLTHPTEQTLGSIAIAYQQYVNTGNTTGGSAASSFLSLVPFIENTDDINTLKSHANNKLPTSGGPANSDRVSCLSCHRAHASGWQHATRWNNAWDFITYVDGTGAAVWPGSDNQPVTNGERFLGRTSTETAAAYYNRPVTLFGAYQRSLCNKCHAKD